MKERYRMAAALAGIMVLVGCSHPSGGAANAHPVRPMASAHAVVPAKTSSVPKGLEGVGLTGTGLSAVLPDPKHPGKLLWKIWAQAVSGNFAAGKGTVQGVTALMFQNGRPAAKMTAPQANYDDAHKVIVATGGVAYASLAQPGSWMHAQAVTYHADTGDGVARGGVKIHDGKNGGTVSTPVVYFDAGLKTVQSYPLHGGR